MSCRSENPFTCTGPLTLTLSHSSPEGTFYLACSSTEENHDCDCSPTQDFKVTTCVQGQTVSQTCPFLTTSSADSCTITWKEVTGYADVQPLSCGKILLSPSCKTDCRWTTTGTLECKSTITCSASRDPARTTSGNMCARVTSDIVTTTTTTTTKMATTTTRTTTQTTGTTKGAGSGPTVLALGVVAGLAIIALIITLVVLLFVFRRHRKRRHTPTNNEYTDVDVREVNNTAYESSVGISSQCEQLDNECSNGNDPKLGLYTDPNDTTIEQSSQSPGQNDTTDNIYNSIDECEPNGEQGYAQTNDLPQPSQDLACPVDLPVTSANYFVLEKQEEMSGGISQLLTEDLNATENYFILDKDEDRVPSDPQDKDADNGEVSVVNPNKADHYFILENQANEQTNQNTPTENYFLLEKEEDETTKENYSVARDGCPHESTTRETTVEGNSEDYDHLFQKSSKNAVYDADNDYDHMNNDETLANLNLS